MLDVTLLLVLYQTSYAGWLWKALFELQNLLLEVVGKWSFAAALVIIEMQTVADEESIF